MYHSANDIKSNQTEFALSWLIPRGVHILVETSHPGFKTYPFLKPIFRESIPDLQIEKIDAVPYIPWVPDFLKRVWYPARVPSVFLIPVSGKSIPFPMACHRTQNIGSASPGHWLHTSKIARVFTKCLQNFYIRNCSHTVMCNDTQACI